MPFVCEDVGTTTRLKMTKTRALAAWERTKGVCVTCNVLIDGTKEAWFVEHIRALELGGKDEAENLGPAHYERCKALKDADDHSRAAKAKRNKRAQLGIRNPVKIQSAGFPQFKKQRRATSPLSIEKTPLPRRQI